MAMLKTDELLVLKKENTSLKHQLARARNWAKLGWIILACLVVGQSITLLSNVAIKTTFFSSLQAQTSNALSSMWTRRKVRDVDRGTLQDLLKSRDRD